MPLLNQKKLVTCVLAPSQCVTMGPTDICKTPAPPAPSPVPLPYPNMAPAIMMGSGWTTKTLTVMGFIWIKGGKSAASLPPHPGVLMNVMTSKYMGMADITMASDDVKAEGGYLSRLNDMTDQNT